MNGIRSIDFKIVAKGHGVVNWNGPTSLVMDSGKTADNHSMPKLRGYTNLSGKVKEENGYKYRKEAIDVDFKKNPLYISQNCVRHHLFKDQAYDLHFANGKNLNKIIASITGLIRGYAVPSSQCSKASPLLLEDFVDQLGNGNFEQFGRSGVRDSSSFFSKTTFGDTEYVSYGSICVEHLQFISLDNKFDRAAMIIKDGQGAQIAQEVQDFINKLGSTSVISHEDYVKTGTIINDLSYTGPARAVFHENYVRTGTIFNEGEQGILLNQEAMEILVSKTLERLSNLTIKQARSYMYVEDVIVDYNDSPKMMRIKRDDLDISTEKKGNYAIYFEGI